MSNPDYTFFVTFHISVHRTFASNCTLPYTSVDLYLSSSGKPTLSVQASLSLLDESSVLLLNETLLCRCHLQRCLIIKYYNTIKFRFTVWWPHFLSFLVVMTAFSELVWLECVAWNATRSLKSRVRHFLGHYPRKNRWCTGGYRLQPVQVLASHHPVHQRFFRG